MKINPLTAIDFYKADHRRQYPEGTTEVYSNLTARSARSAVVMPEYFDNTVVFFGLQYFIKHFLIEAWNEQFFKKDKVSVIKKNSPQYKGVIECLWDIFGGTLTEKGYKLLDSHIGLIYGDSITLENAKTILQRLKDKGYCSGNIVYGVGSCTYQYVTRDNFSLAMKATSGVVTYKQW